MEKLLDSKEAGLLLHLHPKTLERLARRSEVPATKIGRKWRYRESVLDEWIKKQLQCQPPAVPE